MKERPITFPAMMVQAIIAGKKTQTRQIIKPRKGRDIVFADFGKGIWPYDSDDGKSVICSDDCEHPYKCPYGEIGDRLWVREDWSANYPDIEYLSGDHVYFGESKHRSELMRFSANQRTRWRSAIRMPRWASRITLEITDVRVQRLQEISEKDALAEGIVRHPDGSYGLANTRFYHCDDTRQSFFALWESINGDASVMANPYLLVVEFKKLP